MSSLFTPYKLGPVTLRNRTIRSAAFESMGRHFGPTQQLKDYHVSVARGGVGMTTLAYAAVCRSGLSFDKQLWLRPEIVPGLRDITDAVHREGAAAGIQIGHCGNMTHLTTAGQIPIGASTGFNLYAYTPVRGMRAGEIEQVARDFGRAVHTAHDAGFDSVEVHAGHGYLISQFLSPYTNRRRDEYGGSLENRMRFMRMCLELIISALNRFDNLPMQLNRHINDSGVLRQRFTHCQTNPVFKGILRCKHRAHQELIMRCHRHLHVKHRVIIHELIHVMAKFLHFFIIILQLGNVILRCALRGIARRFSL